MGGFNRLLYIAIGLLFTTGCYEPNQNTESLNVSSFYALEINLPIRQVVTSTDPQNQIIAYSDGHIITLDFKSETAYIETYSFDSELNRGEPRTCDVSESVGPNIDELTQKRLVANPSYSPAALCAYPMAIGYEPVTYDLLSQDIQVNLDTCNPRFVFQDGESSEALLSEISSKIQEACGI